MQAGHPLVCGIVFVFPVPENFNPVPAGRADEE